MIYNTFLSNYIKNHIDMSNDIFYIALFTDTFTPNTSTQLTYSGDLLNKAGEISGSGYTKGGKEIFFYSKGEDLITDNHIYYKSQDVLWRDASFEGVKYAVIYRRGYRDDPNGAFEENKDYLVAYFDLGDSRSVSNGVFKLAWPEYTLNINLNISMSTGGGSGSGCDCETDTSLSDTSKNALENQVTTKAIGALGVRFADEELPEYANAISDDVDVLAKLSNKDIADIMEGNYDPDKPNPDDPDNPTPPGPDIDTDDKLDYDSEDPVKNKTLTGVFESLGVVMNDETLPPSAGVLEGRVDSLNEFAGSEIDAIFNKDTEYKIVYNAAKLIRDPEFGITSYEYVSLGSQVYRANQKLVLPKFEIEGYNFKGWYSSGTLFTASTKIGDASQESTIRRSCILYGYYTPY
jgi:hypothetical protein|nr:MAG TPA_asm: hypothetical protein [Caudoviricetes sp.]